MILAPDEYIERLAMTDDEDPEADREAHSKLFTPWSFWTWYMTEYDPEHRIGFGLVEADFTELGYFSLDDIERLEGPGGLEVERDIHWSPIRLSELQERLRS